MNKITKLATMVAASIGVLAMPVSAHDKEGDFGDFYIGAQVGTGWLDTDRMAIIDGAAYQYSGGADLFQVGAELGYRFTPNWDVRVQYADLEGDVSGSNGDANGKMYGSDLLYRFTPKLYTGLGVSRVELGGYKTTFYRGTLGYRTFINSNWAFRWEANLQQNKDNLTEVLTSVGVQYFFGGNHGQQDTVEARPAPARPAPTPAAPAPAPEVDSDNDGVIDRLDKCPGTPETYSVDEEGCVIYTNETITEELLVEFEINSSIIKDSAQDNIADMAEFMKEHPQLDITIEGHTDDTGAADYNQWLSERRAGAVGNVLVNDFDIARERVKSVGYGESKPKVEGTSAAARQANRRIEAKLQVTNRVPKMDD